MKDYHQSLFFSTGADFTEKPLPPLPPGTSSGSEVRMMIISDFSKALNRSLQNIKHCRGVRLAEGSATSICLLKVHANFNKQVENAENHVIGILY